MNFKAPFENVGELALTIYALLRSKPEHEFILMYYRDGKHVTLVDLQETPEVGAQSPSCQHKGSEKESCTLGIYSIAGSKGMLKHWLLHDLKYMSEELRKEDGLR